eukprot:TRINITY_DN65_c7_g1_i1.p1 TRINITY_DN65_c7_g1~~TRINITY_DN65_c7_g1_i1.p1  ORF type:complete len:637 (+),score=222.72 TRINITY_DN65_c7_g1_i1:79-1989(+)
MEQQLLGMDAEQLLGTARDVRKYVRKLVRKLRDGDGVGKEELEEEARAATEALRALSKAMADQDSGDDEVISELTETAIAQASTMLRSLTRGAAGHSSSAASPLKKVRRVAGRSDARDLPAYDQFIGGSWVASHSAQRMTVEDPCTLEELSTIPVGDRKDAEDALEAARDAQTEWAKLPPVARAGFLKKIAEGIRANRVRLAETLAREQAKVLSLAQVEIDFTAEYYDYYAGWARIYEGEVINSDRADEHIYLHHQPIGVAVGIVPWNFPVFVMARKIAPSLLTGNTIVVKTPEKTPNACFEVTKLIAAAGVPAGVVNVITGVGNAPMGYALSESKIPGIISVTGSVGTGVAVMKAAAPNLTKVSLELGGKAPAIICADADLDLAAKAVVQSRVIFTGQVCNCAERVYVDECVFDDFVARLTQHMKEVKVGNPFDSDEPAMCALVSEEQIDKVDAMVQRAKAEGAKVHCGGGRDPSKGPGYFFQPTLLTNVKQDSEIMKDEVFGPVLPVMSFRTLDEAFALANDSDYGLTSSIFTRDINKAHRAMQELKFGETYVNREHFEAIQGFHAGWRKSGIGGADGKHGLMEYVNSHVMYVRYDQSAGSKPSGEAAAARKSAVASSVSESRRRLQKRLSGRK